VAGAESKVERMRRSGAVATAVLAVAVCLHIALAGPAFLLHATIHFSVDAHAISQSNHHLLYGDHEPAHPDGHDSEPTEHSHSGGHNGSHSSETCSVCLLGHVSSVGALVEAAEALSVEHMWTFGFVEPNPIHLVEVHAAAIPRAPPVLA